MRAGTRPEQPLLLYCWRWPSTWGINCDMREIVLRSAWFLAGALAVCTGHDLILRALSPYAFNFSVRPALEAAVLMAFVVIPGTLLAFRMRRSVPVAVH